ncbi:putative 11-oxo-beta-amyrin 30-oxidase [Rosa chinensis]|uniref:Putative 11-oxo-beta-amyrin 30-oxidase n=1 Tax=Rosa chinensis TaxID=74649 RepID=A0A2P6RT69_ROSCH|nr:putative 11-oxo-beta-amyrin 30-oxidase [Rosa chinensis]
MLMTSKVEALKQGAKRRQGQFIENWFHLVFSQRVSLDEFVDECKTFYLARQETSFVFLAWTMFLLALHIDWHEKARKEVPHVFGVPYNPRTERSLLILY